MYLKKVINLIILAIMILLIALLIANPNRNNEDNAPQINITEKVEQETAEGFERHEDLADAFVTAMIDGTSEELLEYMNIDMVASIASENYTNIEYIQSAITSSFSRERSYYLEWLYDNFENATSVSWNISEMFWSEDDEFQELQAHEDYDLGIGGYDYSGLKRDGATKVLYYRTSIDVSDYYDTRYYGFEFLVAQIEGLWYLVGID